MAHTSEPLHGFREQSVIQRPGRFQVCTQVVFLTPIEAECEFQQKGWCLGSFHGVLCLPMPYSSGTLCFSRLPPLSSFDAFYKRFLFRERSLPRLRRETF